MIYNNLIIKIMNCDRVYILVADIHLYKGDIYMNLFSSYKHKYYLVV